MINSPSNPTGVAYSKAELAALAEVLIRHPHVLIATDDMYEHILWTDEPFANILDACPELLPRTIVLNGVSKAYAMTGWRIGYAGGPAGLIKAMRRSSRRAPRSGLAVAGRRVAALNGDQSFIEKMVTAFKTRHDFVIKRSTGCPAYAVNPPTAPSIAFPISAA